VQIIGILGGSFDPIHYGHLRTARELATALGLAQVRFIPSARPPHRAPPVAAAADRLKMLHLALNDEPGFVADDRELKRAGPSYMILTLESLHAELAPAGLCLIVGLDAFLGLDRWHRWQELWSHAHIVVLPRPGWSVEQGLPDWARPHLCRDIDELRQQPAGRLWIQPLTPQDISSTRIRAALARSEPVAEWLPPAVLRYIHDNHLYN
jgi:nicotinate-nucleotide adenylyltransferase